MKLLIYEYVTGGGMWREWPREAPAGSLLNEGAAMVAAVTDDFLAAESHEVWMLRDRRLADFELTGVKVRVVASADEERTALCELASAVDAVLVVAPEIGGALEARCREIEAAGGRLLGPSSSYVAIASDKYETSRRLSRAGLCVPHGVLLSPGVEPPGSGEARLHELSGDGLPDGFLYPVVLKPRHGAGSQGVRRIDSVEGFSWDELGRDKLPDDDWLIEQFVPGTAASVAVLCGPRGRFPLPAWRQRLSKDGRFRYLGGAYPLAEPLDARARRLAASAVTALGTAGGHMVRGYIGVDLVLGDAVDGSQDAVIEINPRLTTSYVGLRRAAKFNLAQAMLLVALGKVPPPLLFDTQPLEFSLV